MDLSAELDLQKVQVAYAKQFSKPARVPMALRRSFGAWADDADALDQYLEWTHQQRQTRPPIMPMSPA